MLRNHDIRFILILILLSCSNDSHKKEWFEIFNTQNSRIPSDFITQIEIDSKHNKWVGTFNGGLLKYDDHVWAVYDSKNSQLPNDTIRSIYIDKNDIVYIVTANGLGIFDGLTWKVFNSSNSPLPVRHISSVSTDKAGNLWAGCGNTSEGGLYLFEDESWTLFDSNNSPFPEHDGVTSIVIDNFDVKWVATVSSGLIKIEGGNWEIFDTHSSSIPYAWIDDLYIDRQNNVWLIMSAWPNLSQQQCFGAISKFENDSFTNYYPSESGKATNRVTASAVDSQNNLWVATSVDACLNVDYALSKFTGEQQWSTYSPTLDNFPKAYILDMATEGDNLWIASDIGIILLNTTQ